MVREATKSSRKLLAAQEEESPNLCLRTVQHLAALRS